MPPTFPKPRAGHLTLYLGGGAGGVGESIVMCMPDGRWVVVDVCSCHDAPGAAGWNFPLTLLRQLDAPRIDLLAITHPDHDHFSGLQELVEGYNRRIGDVWTFPRRTLREITSSARHVLDGEQANARHDLFVFLDEALPREYDIDPLEARHPASRYPKRAPCPYVIQAVFPTLRDMERFRQQTEGHVEELQKLGGSYSHKLRAGITRSLMEGKKPDLESNMLSLGLVIRWDHLKIFFPGDMEIATDQPGSWDDLLAELDGDTRTQGLLDEVDVVKAPHHGSRSEGGTALHEPTWERLRGRRGRVPYVLLTPKNGGTNPPPQQEGLAWLAVRSHVMGMTAAPRPNKPDGGWGYVADAASGWRAMSGAGEDGVGSWVMLDISPHGYITRRAGDQSRWFVRRA